MIETTEKNVRHPEGKMLLMSGAVLDCFPKIDQPAVIIRDKVALDATGEFLQVKGGPKEKPGKPSLEPWEELLPLKSCVHNEKHNPYSLVNSAYTILWPA